MGSRVQTFRATQVVGDVCKRGGRESKGAGPKATAHICTFLKWNEPV